MNLIEPSFDPSTFSKNRQRLLDHNVARQFFDEIVVAASRLDLLSDEHFTVDGTLIEAAASLKSFRPKDKPPADEPPLMIPAVTISSNSSRSHSVTSVEGSAGLRRMPGTLVSR